MKWLLHKNCHPGKYLIDLLNGWQNLTFQVNVNVKKHLSRILNSIFFSEARFLALFDNHFLPFIKCDEKIDVNIVIDMAKIFRESFDKQTDFGHDKANAELIPGDNNVGEDDEAMDEEVMEDTIEETLEENDGLNNDTNEETNLAEEDEAMDEEVMEGTIEETLEENDVVLDGLNNESNEETPEENNVHNDSIVMNECKYCEDAIPNKIFKAHTSNCSDLKKNRLQAHLRTLINVYFYCFPWRGHVPVFKP